MKLVRRLTIYLLAAVALVFALDTWSSVRSHMALFDDDMRRDQALLGRVLASALERVWRSEGEPAARELVASVNSAGQGVRVTIAPAGPADAKQAQTADATAGARRELMTRTPLRAPGGRSLVLEVSESLAHEHSYALARVRQAIGTTLAAIVACGLVAWAVGSRVVGRPIEALVAKARRVSRGDFGSPLALRPETELAQLAREMNEMAANLDAATIAVAEQSAARIAAQEQLRHADRLSTVGKLAAGLAHELGTPLNVVAGRARVIASGEIEGEEEGVECARIILGQADRMTAIVRQLLDFARRRSGEKRSVDLAALARETSRLLEPLAAKRGVVVRCEIESGPLSVRADVAQIQQALMNLVMNGVQASAAGSEVKVALRASAGRAPSQRERAATPHVVLEVSDRGVGIASHQLEQVFDPFFTTKAPGEGTGLGLSVAYGIAEDHGGWIEAESIPEQGSSFRLWLPREGG